MVKEHFNADLTLLNTFGITASAERVVEFAGDDDLREIFNGGLIRDDNWGVLAGGSNIIFTDDYHGTLLHPVGSNIEVLSDEGSYVRVRAEAGVVWDDFVEWCVSRGFWGAENLSWIPGMVGAAPVQNIGAYGAEAKDIIEKVEMFAVDSCSQVILANEYCDFGYRDSIFKNALKGRVVITAVVFLLGREPSPVLGYGDLHDRVEAMGGSTLANIRQAVIDIRREKLPDPAVEGNAGSFFKNPLVDETYARKLKGIHEDMPLYPCARPGKVKLAAGWLIDRSGWKGRTLGPVGVHDKQALVLVNKGGATGKDVLRLARAIQDDVKSRFGIDIEMEVNIM